MITAMIRLRCDEVGCSKEATFGTDHQFSRATALARDAGWVFSIAAALCPQHARKKPT